jgi:hypothetical protein
VEGGDKASNLKADPHARRPDRPVSRVRFRIGAGSVVGDADPNSLSLAGNPNLDEVPGRPVPDRVAEQVEQNVAEPAGVALNAQFRVRAVEAHLLATPGEKGVCKLKDGPGPFLGAELLDLEV